jgi:hypothetical protein
MIAGGSVGTGGTRATGGAAGMPAPAAAARRAPTGLSEVEAPQALAAT